MNNSHLPAGRAGQRGAAGPGMAEMAGERHGGNAVGGGGGGGGGGRNNDGSGPGVGRGGGPRRGRHYGSHYNQHQHPHQHHNPHGPHNQFNNTHSNNNQHGSNAQHGQFGQPPLYQYMGPYPGSANPYAYAQMQPPYVQNGALPNGVLPSAFVPYQQQHQHQQQQQPQPQPQAQPQPQPYGRPAPAGLSAQYAPVMAPAAVLPTMATAPTAVHQQQQQHPSLPPHVQHFSPHTPQHPSQLPLQHAQHPSHPPHPQPPQMSPYARHIHQVPSQAPVIVSTPLPQNVPPPPLLPGHAVPPPPFQPQPQQQQQSPVAAATPFQPPPMPASMTFPTPLPSHMPLPPRTDVMHQPPHGSVPYPTAIPPPNPPLTPSSTLSSHAMATPMSPQSSQPKDATSPDNNAGDGPAHADVPPTSKASTGSVVAPQKEQHQQQHQRVVKLPLSPQTPPSGLKVDNSTFSASYRPPLPWLSRPDLPFPARSTKLRRRRWRLADAQNVELPLNPSEAAAAEAAAEAAAKADHPAAHAALASPVTPSSVRHPASSAVAATPTPAKTTLASPQSASRAAVPATPIVPAIPVRTAPSKMSPAGVAADGKDEKSRAAAAAAAAALATTAEAEPGSSQEAVAEGATAEGETAAVAAAAPLKEAAAPAPLPPKLWTGLFSKATAAATSASPNGTAVTNGHATNGTKGPGAFSKSNANSLAEALLAYRVGNVDKIAFIEPRGLINTGNMCYMNSVLQVLTFCIPFYDFLDQVSKKAAFSFKSETPMIDAMILFLREFKVIDRADPVGLQRRLKSEDLERYGEAFIPEFVYDAIKQLSRFSSMRRGHQQDAEEFLGFLLECLNEECTKVMQEAAANVSDPSSTPNSAHATPAASVTSEVPEVSGGNSGGWLEVGPRQRAAVTRSSGHTSISPVNSIFGGQLRSELRVPGLKDSVTLEPYQSLQLHIDSPEVRNIVDALRGLTKPEILRGDFGSPHGKDVNVTKQVFLETLPPVLILHLKRFQFDWQGNGTVKIGKKVGYPLELEIPREIFSRRKRNKLVTEPLPKYRLNAVVYHHGKQASGGHYTVDVLREDGREWIRLDDTVIRRIRREDVAEAGAEESGPSGKADSFYSTDGASGKRDGAAGPAAPGTPSGVGSANRFAAMVGDDDDGNNKNVDDTDSDGEQGWRQVSSPVNGGNKKWSSVANGTATPPAGAAAAGTPSGSGNAASSKAKPLKENIKDNKVAYLLFYQRIN
ncbi:ubiquitin hydrolase [Niveomyces insectorum RCEF 264]|uniref:ubiquitinyl hydrolase 1 n=1 Tax=Niveomyces insectorum RCEF 264 TaxID=1081102 RepID=A0A167S030_9HYPO|nr:ubiquitin hydrolase [Niveomyces insectorum RCEF 264]